MALCSCSVCMGVIKPGACGLLNTSHKSIHLSPILTVEIWLIFSAAERPFLRSRESLRRTGERFVMCLALAL